MLHFYLAYSMTYNLNWNRENQMDKAMKLNRVERRLLMLLEFKLNQGESAIELYRRIRLRYTNFDSYHFTAYNAIYDYLHLAIGKHMPIEYIQAIAHLSPFTINGPNFNPNQKGN
jgi:hypothetical protein